VNGGISLSARPSDAPFQLAGVLDLSAAGAKIPLQSVPVDACDLSTGFLKDALQVVCGDLPSLRL
jgi:hypothetical protein